MPADSLAALDSDGSPRHLVVDALNLLTDYFLPDDRGAAKGDAWTMLAVMQRRVAGFLEACANTTPALVPHFVIDAGWQSEEAATKWRKRREREVRAHARTIPLSADTFLADALRAAGAKVYQVEGADGDDIVAVLARALGATSLILSADRDMFRYDDTVLPDAPKRVAASFSFAEAAPRGTRGASSETFEKNLREDTKDTKDTRRAE
jgi:heme-degrading monooxygenase HmoA